MNQKTNYCDSCGKQDKEVDKCFCNERDFRKYPSNGFSPEETWKAEKIKKDCLL